MKPILLGMNNPLSDDPTHALYPQPDGCTGHRIFLMIKSRHSNLTMHEYLAAFDRQNLIVGDDWHLPTARKNAGLLWTAARRRRIVFFGAQVAEAMGVKNRTTCVWIEYADVRYACVPHPSGRNRWYNDPENLGAATRFLAALYADSVGGA